MLNLPSGIHEKITDNYFLLTALMLMPSGAFAQGMMGSASSSIDNVAIQNQGREEQEGKMFLDNLNNKKTTCSLLKDTDFEKIGEYFMDQAIGDTSKHIAMNEIMEGMMGEKGEKQMHIAWGKRGSDCDTSSQDTGFMPIMGMLQTMGGGGNLMMGYGGWNNIMGNSGFGILGWLPKVLFWVLLVLGIVALFRYLGKTGRRSYSKIPIYILKERYAQ